MMSEFLELKIPIGDNTTKKIVALAALTGKNLSDIKDDIAADLVDEQAFDEFVSHKLHTALAALDGAQDDESTEEEITYSVSYNKKQGRKSFAHAEQQSNDVFEDIAGHSLSGDEDTGAPSLEDQYKKEEAALRAQPVATQAVKPQQKTFEDQIFANDTDFAVAEGEDDFLDVMDVPQKPKQAVLKAEAKKVQASPRVQTKVKVSAYTGDEDAPLF